MEKLNVINQEYTCEGHLYVNGQAYEHYFSHGYIETLNGKVIGGDISFKDGNTTIDIYISRGCLSIFRPSTQPYHSRGYATVEELRTYDIPFTLDRIKQILKKDYKEIELVKPFMELAREIFKEHECEFDRRGDWNG